MVNPPEAGKPRAFVVEFIVSSDSEEATADHLHAAVMHLLAKAKKYPPDSKFNWEMIHVDVVPWKPAGRHE